MFYIAMVCFGLWSWGALYITRSVLLISSWERSVRARHLADGRSWTPSTWQEEVTGFALTYSIGCVILGARALRPDVRVAYLNGILNSIPGMYPECTQEEFTELVNSFTPLLTA